MNAGDLDDCADEDDECQNENIRKLCISGSAE